MNRQYQHFAAVQKIAAARQQRTRQRGVKMGYNENAYLAASTRFASAPIAIGVDDFSLEFFGNTYGSSGAGRNTLSNLAQQGAYAPGCFMVFSGSAGKNGIATILFEGTSGGDALRLDWQAPTIEERFHLIITRSGKTVKAYINGLLKATKAQTSIKDMGNFQLGIANSSDVGFARIYNHALSAEQAATLCNGGDPAGYVLPQKMKKIDPVDITGDASYTWEGVESPYSVPFRTSRLFTLGQFYQISITVSDYVSGAPFFKISTTGTTTIPAANGTYDFVVQAMGTPYSGVYMYAGANNSDRRLTLTVNSIQPVGCIAEYLPQNLVEVNPPPPVEIVGNNTNTWMGVDDPTYYFQIQVSRILKQGEPLDLTVTVSNYEAGAPFSVTNGGSNVLIPAQNGTHRVRIYASRSVSVIYLYGGLNGSDRRLTLTLDSVEPAVGYASSWLDSAKQLPLNDAYLPPLLQTHAGNDLAANGVPEILYQQNK